MGVTVRPDLTSISETLSDRNTHVLEAAAREHEYTALAGREA